MADNEEKKEQQEVSSYQFMDQVIKKRPLDRKAILLRLLWIAIAGILIGFLASFVFSIMHPEIKEASLAKEEAAKITIAPDEDPLTPSATPTAVPTTTTPTETPTPEPVTPTPEPETNSSEIAASSEGTTSSSLEEQEGEAESEEGAPAAIPGITLEEYRQLYQDMLAVSEESEHALVQVIGISSEMDYFNQNIENQNRVSGLIVAITETDVYVLSEYRAVDQVERIQVVFHDGTMTDANFQRADTNTGLAVLKIPAGNISEETAAEIMPATLGNSNFVSRGEPVLALGSPLGYSDSVAYGIVTSISNTLSAVDVEYALLTTDIDGSSDGSGVLINLDGAVIGMIAQGTGTDSGSITALAISQIKELIQDLSNNEPQNYVGIRGQDVTQEITDRTGIPRGILLTAVEQDSPAMLAGLKEYDVLVRVGEEPVETMRDYHRWLRTLEPESTATITAMRRGAEGYTEFSFEVSTTAR